MEIAPRYNPADVESKWYQHWESRGYFRSVPDDREAFTVVIPPPNVTGVLHMGHMLNNTIQDILIRDARLRGLNACWVPGTDHASIATEAKVVRFLREKGIRKGELSREEFMKHAWEWKEKYGGIILQQLKRLGASCDWERTAFTMDEAYSRDVIDVFVELFKSGKLYRGQRMVNWDPEALTVLSGEEVIHTEENAQLYHIRYQMEGSDEGVVIATQRPETIFADVAVAVNPNDPRYKGWAGKKLLVPLINRPIPVIFDEYVDIEFGTGALKITPAHDPNDYEIGQKHGLEVIDILNDDGTLNELCNYPPLIGQDRFVARKQMKRILEDSGHLVDIRDYRTKIGRSERTNAVVEPKLSLQWFVRMEELGKPALDAVMNGDIAFFPENFKNLYRNWLENLRDWCVSRQLWWGHRIPAWYLRDEEPNKETTVFVAATAEEALEQARQKMANPALQLEDLRQDEDVLDTWASSWLWPISLFDGMKNPDGEFSYYYPTSVLVTGWDIIFFWVARMIMAGYEFKGEKPFEKVYFTGMVRDQQRRKMSKSLGNSPDALELIDQYGADGVRFGILSSSPAGGDLLFDEKLCEQGRNFSNKIWNALRLVKAWEEKLVDRPAGEGERLAIQGLRHKWNKFAVERARLLSQFRLSDLLMQMYGLIWDDFCSWYLEWMKPGEEGMSRECYEETVALFEEMMIALHPFMPFLTEEVWQVLRDRKEGEDIIVARYPEPGQFDAGLIQAVETARELITRVRDVRSKNALSPKEAVPLSVAPSAELNRLFERPGWTWLIHKLANLSSFERSDEEVPNAVSFVLGTDTYFVELNIEVDVAAELERLRSELEYARGFVNSVSKKLSNERFVSGAPAAVVEKERQKLADGEARVEQLRAEIARLEA